MKIAHVLATLLLATVSIPSYGTFVGTAAHPERPDSTSINVGTRNTMPEVDR
jgi:hypothetical protein